MPQRAHFFKAEGEGRHPFHVGTLILRTCREPPWNAKRIGAPPTTEIAHNSVLAYTEVWSVLGQRLR